MNFIKVKDEMGREVAVNKQHIQCVANDTSNSGGYGDRVVLLMVDGTKISLPATWDGYEDGENPYTYSRILNLLND